MPVLVPIIHVRFLILLILVGLLPVHKVLIGLLMSVHLLTGSHSVEVLKVLLVLCDCGIYHHVSAVVVRIALVLLVLVVLLLLL